MKLIINAIFKKMAKNDQKWPKMIKNGQKMAKNDQKWPKNQNFKKSLW